MPVCALPLMHSTTQPHAHTHESRSTDSWNDVLNAFGTSFASRQIDARPAGSAARRRSASPPPDERKLAWACTDGFAERTEASAVGRMPYLSRLASERRKTKRSSAGRPAV